MKVISLLNLKGGVAKSFTAVNLGYELWRRGYRVLLLDNDKQGNLSKGYGRYDADKVAPVTRMLNGDWSNAEEFIQTTDYEGMDIVTANMSLFGVVWNLIKESPADMLGRYRKFMEADTGDGMKVQEKYDYCIIDNPPDIGLNVLNALMITDEVIVPVKIDENALEGLDIVAEQIEEAKALNPSITLKGVLVTSYQNTDGESAGLEWLHREWENASSEHYRKYPVLGIIRYSKKVAENSFIRKPIYEYSPLCGAAQDYKKFVTQYTGKGDDKMAKAKFGIGDIIDIRGQKPGQERESVYKEIWLNPREVKPSESNFYSQENIEELADSFLTVGQQQPTVLARIDGEYRIVSGHRRNLANIKNLERGHKEYEKVRYLYRDMTPAMLELSLLMGNAYNRELTPWEKTQQAQRLKEALLRAKNEDGLEITGKLRDVVADLMHESSSNIAKMNSIHKNATPEIKEEFKKGNLGITAAYEAAKLPSEKQKEIAGKSAGGESVPVKEITGKEKVFETNPSKSGTGTALPEGRKVFETNPVREQPVKEKPEEQKVFETNPVEEQPVKAKPEGREVFETNPVKEQSEGITGKGKDMSRHMKILQEWSRSERGLPVIKKPVARAMKKVSETSSVKAEWTDTDWAVFISKGIMYCANYVSEEDLYLLHDIMLRCREKSEE